ncbi:right-handed parallel beta-helix repeat-containing protein [Dyadobacter pollutisoli]|uniref:Right-handed parallel beta-helix repeat-containing protein n=1 Tax=Dyadobacter pollutisoli TaxID=2910158 RepID=A0A9E8NCN1_9BACT|nr:right-handed parallel beta-helix repeat-containing protein [Dyadobacter pollutisoli]WAC12546.1 right-handed parallel beta-helix repeat-containing protein [Dyadobacter pollutisoli]
MIRYFTGLLLGFAIHVQAQVIDVTSYGAKPDSFGDATESVGKAITASKTQEKTVISFPKGRYDFWPDKAVETHYYISNSSSEEEFPVKKQRVGLFFKGLKNVTLEGNGSEFVFHGKMITWVIDSSENITIRNISVNYERPGMSEMTIKESSPTTVIATVHPDSKFDIINGRLEWYGEKWVARNFHAVLVRPEKGMLLYSTWEPFLKSKAEVIAPLTVKFTGDFSKFKGEPGEVLTVRDRYRDYVGAFINRSKNISLHNLHMNSMHGLGIVSQFSENLNYDSVFVEPAQNSGRVIASSADGMHFSGCRGQITISNCRFSGLHDDPINVHGTHLKVTEIVSPNSLKIKFMHHQTYGFEAFSAGDTVAYLHSASLQIFGQGIVKTARLISEREMLVEMQAALPKELKIGDALENTTWTPAVTIKNSRFERIISRGNLITTRRKVIIENNVYYRTGMHAILIENDASGWYESGIVTDLTVRNNQFIECGFNSAPNNYVININPEAHELVPGYYVHKNIRIENNVFKVYDDPVLSALSTDGLTFINNTIERTNFLPPGNAREAIKLVACTGVTINGNRFGDTVKPVLSTSKMVKKDLKSDIPVQIK